VKNEDPAVAQLIDKYSSKKATSMTDFSKEKDKSKVKMMNIGDCDPPIPINKAG
jgi:hypothetical protein